MAFLNLFDQRKLWELSEKIPLEPLSERKSIYDALGLICAEDVLAPEDIPPKARSEVDGYAVRSRDVKGASVERPSLLTRVGSIVVDEAPQFELNPGECVYIPTGAILPKGADAVVMIEYVEESGNYVEVFKAVAPLENVVSTGEDMKQGDIVLKRGQRITPQVVGLLSYLGKLEVQVYRPLRVFVAATGNEIVEPTQVPSLGQYRDANSLTVWSMLKERGFYAHRDSIIRDELENIREVINKATQNYDVIVLTGGSSAGIRDLVVRAVEKAGGTVLAHGFTIKPGKPTVIGIVKDKLFVGLPGHPMSCFVSASLILMPLLRKLQGENVKPMPLLKARLRTAVFSRIGVEEWIPVRLSYEEELWAEPVFSKSGMVSSMVRNEGFLRIPPECEGMEPGEVVEVLLL
ncbi:MAG TPA: molybdopterin molybdenumtransferase MoeA [Coprothermobacter sp.]|jgi:molybdopterin molybdotransferase|nr:molybdopterin molybdenumtransferase MoeA [Coprothermobacter sp.]